MTHAAGPTGDRNNRAKHGDKRTAWCDCAPAGVLTALVKMERKSGVSLMVSFSVGFQP